MYQSVKRGNGVAPVALGSKLGWLLSGPVTKHNASSLTTHIENNALHIKTTNFEEGKLTTFGNYNYWGFKKNDFQPVKK